MDGAALPAEEPGENQHEIAHEIGMDRYFPHQVLQRRVGVVVVLHLVFQILSHLVLPFVDQGVLRYLLLHYAIELSKSIQKFKSISRTWRPQGIATTFKVGVSAN